MRQDNTEKAGGEQHPTRDGTAAEDRQPGLEFLARTEEGWLVGRKVVVVGG